MDADPRTRTDLLPGRRSVGQEDDRSGGAALASDVLLAQLAALLLGGAAPDPGVLVGGEGVLEARGLGLSIVRTLVTSELAGTISLERGTAAGPRPGTVVRLDVPVAPHE